MQEGCDRPLEGEKGEGGATPRGCSARPPPPSVAETDPADDAAEPSLPTAGGLKLSLLGSYGDASKSPPAAFFSASRCYGGGGGAVSPAESAGSSTNDKVETVALPLSGPPDNGATSRRKDRPSSSSSACSCPLPSLSSPVDKLLHLPRGRSLRFFIDGDDGLANNEKRSMV